MFRKSRVLISLFVSTAFVLTSNPSQAVWQFDSENDRSGISAYAATYWAQGYGPVSLSRLMNLDMEESDLWGILTLSCQRRSLRASIGLYQAGSGNDSIRLDNPGYVTITLNSTAAKRYRTTGSDSADTFFLAQTDSKNLARAILSRSYLSISPRIKYSNKRVNMLFDVTSLSKGKTRFRYAGCTL